MYFLFFLFLIFFRLYNKLVLRTLYLPNLETCIIVPHKNHPSAVLMKGEKVMGFLLFYLRALEMS